MTQTDTRTTVEEAPARRGERAEYPQRVGSWELVGLAGEGALTRVYQARPLLPARAPAQRHAALTEPAADRPAAYALKMLRPEYQDDPRAIALLRREALVGRSVSHPHLISVLGAGMRKGPHYVVMPWLSGATLSAHRAAGSALEQPTAFWIARQVAEALGALHESGWMHGDVKPGNVFLSPEGHATLLDLGFARRIDRPEPAAQRVVAGTCNYIAPEMLSRGQPVDGRSDVYSLGVVLFEMLSGRLPFAGADAAEVARMHREARPPSLAKLVPELHPDAATLVGQMLAKQPLRRPQGPRELIERLARLEIGTFARPRPRAALISSG
jgi:serine/threonine-protein kinase